MTNRRSKRELGNRTSTDQAVAKLCPRCGLCCNGVLFADVELQPGDRPKHLAALGLALRRSPSAIKFDQPCNCFEDGSCRIYEDRPVRCRTFECRLLQHVSSGHKTVEHGLRAIGHARRQVDGVRRLVRVLGQTDEHLPLSRRYAQVMAEPIDLAGDAEVVTRRGELMLAVHGLMQVLQREFLPG